MLNLKLYENKEELLKDNMFLLDGSNEELILTNFFPGNAEHYVQFDRYNYSFKIESNDSFLLILAIQNYPTLVYGAIDLVKEACKVICDYNLYFERLIGNHELIKAFQKEYISIRGGSFDDYHQMSIMMLKQLVSYEQDGVFKCQMKDLNSLISIYQDFYQTIYHRSILQEEVKEILTKDINSYYAYKVDEEIVSIASITRSNQKISAISHVYTRPEFRNHHYARKVVSKVCDEIMSQGKVPYLYVDRKNPISNHLYLSLGFSYLSDHTNCSYQKGNIQTALLAGGCFWCIAEPFYSVNGVLEVVSGYAGGTMFNPTYEDVKAGNTGHRESILIVYDANQIHFADIFEIYLQHINPFDSGGQFIDRGSNYTCAVFTSDQDERNYVQKRIVEIEKKFQKKVYISLLKNQVFYKAIEEHQNYALKHPNEMKEELKKSGRM